MKKVICVILFLLCFTFSFVCCDLFINENSNQKSGINSETYYINDTVTSSNLQFTVLSVSNTKEIKYGTETDNNYIVVKIKIKNIGNYEATIYDSSFSLKKGNITYNVSIDSIYLDNGFYLYEDIGSGLTKTFQLAFETPSENTEYNPFTLVVTGSYFATNQEILLKNK